MAPPTASLTTAPAVPAAVTTKATFETIPVTYIVPETAGPLVNVNSNAQSISQMQRACRVGQYYDETEGRCRLSKYFVYSLQTLSWALGGNELFKN